MKFKWYTKAWRRVQNRITRPTLKVGFDWDGGASYDTVLAVLAGWSVTTITKDGRTLEGMVVNEFYDECLHLHDWSNGDTEWSVTPLHLIKKITVN